MANNLIYAIAQYGISKTPERLYVSYIEGVTGEEKEFRINRVDMGNPDKQIFDTFKNQVEKHVIDGGTLKQAVVQYSIEGFPERMIVQYSIDSGEASQDVINRVDMVNPDAQIFDNFKNLVEQHII